MSRSLPGGSRRVSGIVSVAGAASTGSSWRSGSKALRVHAFTQALGPALDFVFVILHPSIHTAQAPGSTKYASAAGLVARGLL